jgi:pyruvate ferredoxin oxidoreductase gamma subunit
MREIRWHGRGGQGAKTASHLLALAALEAGRCVQAFPEFGPERSGAPMGAYNRIDDRPIRRRHGVVRPDAVVVLDPSLVGEVDMTAGLPADGLLLVNTDDSPEAVRCRLRHDGSVVCIPGDRLAARAGTRFASVVMLGALAAALGEPPLETLDGAVCALLGRKLAEPAVEATRAGIREGHGFIAGAELDGEEVACLG